MVRFWALLVLVHVAGFGLAQDEAGRIKDKIQVKDDVKVKEKDKLKIKAKVKEKEKTKVIQKVKDLEFKGTFTDADPRDPQRNGPTQAYVVKMKAAKSYTIDMVSTQLDSYLRLQDAKGTQLDEDDDSGGMLNSRIIFNCTKDGDYKIICTTFAANGIGSYVMTVKATVNNQKPLTSHALLVGKEAHDFKGDFAVNGPAVKLSELKGKVVLLAFWEVRSTASAELLPTLAEWNKKFKSQGLAMVGVTFYTSEIGQKLGIDKESGKIKGVKLADVMTDRALIENYASHHKINHMLMALPKAQALTVFDAYAVNSLPQMVLIDRRGMVRMIHVGGSKSSADVENELKKLIEEK